MCIKTKKVLLLPRSLPSYSILLTSRLLHLIWFMKELWKVMSNFCLYFGPPLSSNKINSQHQYWVVILLEKRSLWLDSISDLSRSSPKLKWLEQLNCLTEITSFFLYNKTSTLNRLYVSLWVFYWMIYIEKPMQKHKHEDSENSYSEVSV